MRKFFMIVAALAAMTSCNKSVFETATAEAGYGYISLGVATDDDMVVTKGLTENSALAGYHIGLFDNNSGNAAVWKQSSSLNVDSEGFITYEQAIAPDNASIWKVKAGTYTVKIYNKKAADAYTGNGVVRVEGQNSNIVVTAGHTADAQVTCDPVNSKVSFATDASFEGMFEGTPAVTVKGGLRNVSVTTVGTSTTTHTTATQVYFEPVQVKWTLKATAKLDGLQKTFSGNITLQKAKWSQVTFSTKTVNGVINLVVTVNGEITQTVTENVEIDPFNPTPAA